MTKPPTTRSAGALVALGCLLAPLLTGVAAQAAPLAPRAAAPVHTLEVAGAGVGSYPSYDPAVERYAVTTTAATGGTITVTATTSDPTGTIYIDGVPDADGEATLSGLVEGDEVAVWVEDAAGLARHSYVYLPAGFPTLEAVVPPGEVAPETTPGAVLLGLSNTWLRGFPGQEPGVPDYVETAVDRLGVPLHVESFPALPRTLDLKRQPNGNYSVARTTTTPGRTGEAIIELDERFREVARHETVGLVNTDGHDAILLPDGTTWLMAYEHDGAGLVDSVIQRIDPDGSLGFQWTSAPYVEETVAAGPDYAHINSFALMGDGSLLASFRNLSSVFKIDTTTFAGEVVWKLGGRDSDFEIVDGEGVPDGGPCAQHSAHELPNGDIVLFDNGSSDFFEALCLTPDDPNGAPVQRPRSRVLTLRPDVVSGTAEVVGSHAPAGRFAWFAGSTQPLPQEHLLVGWASATQAVATELDAAGETVWELRDANPDASRRYFSYRAQLGDVPDGTAPTVTWDAPPDGTVLVQGDAVVAAYTCRDRGGSSLQACAGDLVSGGAIATSEPGQVKLVVRATDGAGRTTTSTRAYTVRPAARPDAWVKVKGAGGSWVGRDVYGPASAQRAKTRLKKIGGSRTIVVKLQNDGAEPDRLGFEVKRQKRGFRIASVNRGETKELDPGEAWKLRIKVTRGRKAEPGKALVLKIPVRSLAEPSARDAVSVKVKARGDGR